MVRKIALINEEACVRCVNVEISKSVSVTVNLSLGDVC